MNHIRKILLAACAFGILSIQSCTDLTEEVSDRTPADQFGKNPEQLAALIGPIYGGLGDYFDRLAALNTVTDEQVVPTRGGDWDDGGNWLRLHQHNWETVRDNQQFNPLWTWCYGGIARINRALVNPSFNSDPGTVAELRTLRAFYHYIAMDSFGSVIIADGTGGDAPPQRTRAEVFNYVEQELLAVLPDLSETSGGAYYGRMNKWVAHMLLAKLYLNAQVYTGTPQWAKAVQQCDAIINSGKFSVPADFFSNFSINNQGSPEIILATPFDRSRRGGMNIQMRTLHYQNQLTYNLGSSPWNGYATLAEFYNSFSDNDIRKRMWIVGQQFSATGAPLTDDNVPLVITPEIPSIRMPAGPAARAAGARSQKYEIQRNNKNNDQDNDFIVYRLADVYLMRGEAKFRLGVAGALEDINFVRTKRGVPAFTALTLDEILAERGRELAWELHRRQDLIRFDRFTRAWSFKPASEKFRELYPIPQDQINLNPNLKQNPGY
jgi:hypothetical protein